MSLLVNIRVKKKCVRIRCRSSDGLICNFGPKTRKFAIFCDFFAKKGEKGRKKKVENKLALILRKNTGFFVVASIPLGKGHQLLHYFRREKGSFLAVFWHFWL